MKKLMLLFVVLVLLSACQVYPFPPPTQQFVEDASGFSVAYMKINGCTVGQAVVQKKNRQFVDDMGHPLPYEEMTVVDGAGAFIVRNGESFGMVNKDFEVVVPVLYDSILQARNWSYDSVGDYVEPPIFYLFQGESIYSLNWEEGLLATFSQSMNNPEYLYKHFSVVITKGESPFAHYRGELDCSIEYLMPGLKNTEFALYSPLGEAFTTAIMQPTPNGYHNGLTYDFGVDAEHYAAVSGEVSPLALQPVSAEQLPVGLLPEQARFIEGFRTLDGQFIASFSVLNGDSLFCRLVLADDGKITLLQEYKNGTTGPPIDPKVLLYAQLGNKKYLYFATPDMQGYHCVEVEL